MSWKLPIRSHIAKLTLTTSVLVGLLLVAVFAATLEVVRNQALAEKQSELRNATGEFVSKPSRFPNLEEFHEAYPEMTAVVYDESLHERARTGKLPLTYRLGYGLNSDYVSLGVSIRSRTMVVATSWRDTERGIEQLGWVLIGLWFPLVGLIGFLTHRSATSVFQPLRMMTEQAAQISGANLRERLEIQDSAEFGQFAIQLNGLLDRVEKSARQLEQFSADAAHELRTPLAILRLRMETTLLTARSTDSYIAALNSSLEEIERLSSTTEALLSSARAPETVAPVIDLEPEVLRVMDKWVARFAEKDQRLDWVVHSIQVALLPDECSVILDNLLGNALRFSQSRSTTTVKFFAHEDVAVLSVIDQGSGVPPELQNSLFDRFVRGDDSRNRQTGGAGIGLAICKRIVDSRKGRIQLVPAERGTTIECRFPIA